MQGNVRILLALAGAAYFTLSVALAAPSRVTTVEPRAAVGAGRAPAITHAPLVIKKVFTAPVGEVQFVAGAGRTSVFLRTTEGAICELESVEGEAGCMKLGDAKAAAPANVRCVFLFEKGPTACRHRIYSYELQESDLFRVVKSATRAGLERDTSAY